MRNRLLCTIAFFAAMFVCLIKTCAVTRVTADCPQNFVQPPYVRAVSLIVRFRACLHGGGGPQVGEVTRLGGVTRSPYILSF